MFVTLTLLIKYQNALHLRYGAWLTVLAGISIMGLAVASGLQNNYPLEFQEEHIEGRGVVVAIWITAEIVLIIAGVIMKVIVPCTPQPAPFRVCDGWFRLLNLVCVAGHVVCLIHAFTRPGPALEMVYVGCFYKRSLGAWSGLCRVLYFQLGSAGQTTYILELGLVIPVVVSAVRVLPCSVFNSGVAPFHVFRLFKEA